MYYMPIMGITASAVTQYAATTVAGHNLIILPGMNTVVGKAWSQFDEPRWVKLSPYAISETAISESQYREVLGHPGVEAAPGDHPVTMVSFNDAQEYMRKSRAGLKLPTDNQYENAARGPALNMQEVMEEEVGRFIAEEFPEFAHRRFENFVFDPGSPIYSWRHHYFQKEIAKGVSFYGWRAYATSSGRLEKDELWWTREKKVTAPVDWGARNVYGLYGMTGGVSEWTRNAYEEFIDTDTHGRGLDYEGPKIHYYEIDRWHRTTRCGPIHNRFPALPDTRNPTRGFRVVMESLELLDL